MPDPKASPVVRASVRPTALLRTTALAFLTSLLLVVPAQASPARSADRSEVVFTTDGRIASMAADGSGRRFLSGGGPGENFTDRLPQISPDGRNLMFVRDSDYDPASFQTRSRLMIAKRDGSGPRAILDSENLSPKGWLNGFGASAWSESDGRILVVLSRTKIRGDYRRNYEIISMAPDGTDRRVVFRDEFEFRGGVPVKSSEEVSHMDVSADGSSILATFQRLAGNGTRLAAIDVASGHVRTVFANAEQGAFSPDGDRVAFLSERDRAGERCPETNCHFDRKLYVANLDGPGIRKIPGQRTGVSGSASWSPDGSRIVFASDRNSPDSWGNGFEIYSVRPDGTCLTWLTNGSPASLDPSFGPEQGADPGPGTCDAAKRKPVSRIRPSRNKRVLGEPLLWAGPIFGTNVVSFASDDYGAVGYTDCIRFDPDRCGGRFTLEVTDVCWNDVSQTIAGSGYGGMIRRRGGLVLRTDRLKRNPGPTVFMTGGRAVVISSAGLGGGPTRFRDHLEMIDALRIAKRTRPLATELPAAILARSDIQTLTALRSSLARTGSIRTPARNSGMTPGMASDFLRFGRDVERFGLPQTKKCTSDGGPVTAA